MTPHTIYFVRHGETVWNTERRLQGSIDSPLTERGRAQALANAQTLIEAVPEITVLPFVVSPLGRARATLRIIRERIGLPDYGYQIDERLAEVRFGDWEGLTFKEIETRFSEQWAVRQTAKWAHMPPNGESFAQASERLKDWARDLRSDVVVVAHGAVGRILRGLNLGMPEEQIAFSGDPLHDRVYRLSRGTEVEL
ncbi:MAG: histidine phosphatase family protein [Alphaproteobacteria bacterium]|nr:histidine phosphatase family protein [Alphaproteobacteria bacterium]